MQICDVCNLPALGNSVDIKCGKCYKLSQKRNYFNGCGEEFDSDDVDDCDPSSIIYRVRETSESNTFESLRNGEYVLKTLFPRKLALPRSLEQARPLSSSSNQLENHVCPTRPASSSS